MKGRVQFDHISFRYNPERPEVLRNINLDTQPGEVIGIVGCSGSSHA